MNPTLYSLAALTAAVVSASASAQMFDEQTATRFPIQGTTYTNQLTIGDIDNDGDLDIIWANGGNFSSPGPEQRQDVYINDGTATFTNEWSTRLHWQGLCRGVELGDIDDDGDLDMIFAQDFNRQPTLWLNDGDGFFTDATSQLPQITLSSSRAQFGDIDNDGDLDIYITSGTTSRFTCGQYRVYMNDGTGNFTDGTATHHPIANWCNNMDCIFGDVDGDLDLDIRTASTGTNNSRLLINNGAGVYALSATPSDSNCYSYDFGDINGDGDLDLLGANGGGNNIEILLSNNGLGTFSNVSGQISPNPQTDDNDSKFFDYDNDGDLDLIVGHLGAGGERLYTNNGEGFFTQAAGLIEVFADSTLDVKVADLDNDGDFDVVTGQGESGVYTDRIYINTTGPADTIPPTILETEQLADTKDTAGPYVVRAAILDSMTSDRNFFDHGIFLNWSVGAGPVNQVEMDHSGGQIYRGEIPGLPGGGEVSYFVSALDFNDNLGTGPTLVFDVIGGDVPGDVDGDGDVDINDLLDLLGAWGPCPPPPCPADFNGDGIVGITDLLILLANWG